MKIYFEIGSSLRGRNIEGHREEAINHGTTFCVLKLNDVLKGNN